MAVTYNTILREVAIAVNALTGATPTLLQSSYATVPLTSANFQSSIFPFYGLIDKILDAESEIVTTVASTGDHPYRSFLTTQTSALAYGALLSTDASGNKIIGVLGDVRDSVTGQPCTKNELRQIQDRVINPGTMWLITVWWYAISDRRIYHTVSSVIVDVITYTRPVADSLVLTTNISLPDDALPAYVNGALMACIRDDEFMAQGARYGELFNAWVAQVKAGYMSIDSTSRVVEKAA